MSFILTAVLLAGTGAAAQTPPATAPKAAPVLLEPERADRAEGRRNQKVELIHHEDAANVIDEVRYAGQTQSITVRPKNSAMPGYEVPGQGRARASNGRDGSNNPPGTSLWNIRKF